MKAKGYTISSMTSKVFVYDPTISDTLSRARGIGRYLEVLKENFSLEFEFIADSRAMTYDSIFINPFFNFLQPPTILKRIAKKQIAVIHDLIPLKYPEHFPFGIKGGINIFLNRQVLKDYDFIITDSQASKKDIIQILKIKENIIKVVYPCLSKTFINYSYQEQKSINKNEKYCIYVGDATWNKNLVNLAKAIKIADVVCIFVGKVFKQNQTESVLSNPWQKELKEFLSLAKDDKRFIFPGYISNEELVALYQKAVVNILVSRDEGFGFSYLEASSQKCPSILSDIAVLREISDNNAVFADPDSPPDIADKINKIFSDNSSSQKKLGLKTYERMTKFSSENFKKSFWAVLNSGDS